MTLLRSCLYQGMCFRQCLPRYPHHLWRLCDHYSTVAWRSLWEASFHRSFLFGFSATLMEGRLANCSTHSGDVGVRGGNQLLACDDAVIPVTEFVSSAGSDQSIWTRWMVCCDLVLAKKIAKLTWCQSRSDYHPWSSLRLASTPLLSSCSVLSSNFFERRLLGALGVADFTPNLVGTSG